MGMQNYYGKYCNCHAYFLSFNWISEIKEIDVLWHLFNGTMISEQFWQINGDKYLYLGALAVFVTLLLLVEVSVQASSKIKMGSG